MASWQLVLTIDNWCPVYPHAKCQDKQGT